MSFLPEEDQDFLAECGIDHTELSETLPGGNQRRGVLFPSFRFTSNLRRLSNGVLVPCENCDLLVVIPDGYATTKLDSFYTDPQLKLANSALPQNVAVDVPLFGKNWQFWSRHLNDQDWRVGIDGLRSFLNIIRGELRAA